MIQDAGGVRGVFEYNADLFRPDTIERMSAHFLRLLEGIVACPGQRLADLPLLTTEEQIQQLVEWNNTQNSNAQDKCLHQLFEAQAEKTPESLAAIFRGEQLTYRDLNRRANQLAHCLQKLGIGPEVPVGIYLERSLEMVVGLLGVLKAGGAYIPLDPSSPRERLAFMLEDAQVPLLLAQQRLLEQLPAHAARVLCLDADGEIIAREGTENPADEMTTENLAYVIYTSGSTGKPKGVQVSHRAVSNLLNSMRLRPGLTEQDTVLAVTSLSFDIAALELFLPITIGARLVITTHDVAGSGTQLSEVLAGSGVTVLQATPATWRLLVEAGWQGNSHLKILCGGEALAPELAAQLVTKGSSLWNLYGPTETTIWSAVSRVESTEGRTAIGQPIDNTQFYILDSYLRPVPVGVAGELYIGGTGLARGYLNRPELTAEKFVPDPFTQEPGARLYKTGDLVRYRPDGNVEFLSRLDHQVKIRGFRIEPGEIETTLGQHPAVRQSVVVAQEDPQGEKRLVAYVVSRQEPNPDVAELRSYLMKNLPEYMLPSAFVFLAALPLTPNGKVDRRSLPAPDPLRHGRERLVTAPRTPLEHQLTKIWEKVLGARDIGVKDNFFELGGHSLLAVRLFARIERAFGKHLALATLFRAPTIEEQANLLSQEQCSESSSSLVAIQPGGSKPPFFCVHGHDGQVLFYRELAQHLGTDQPFYGLQAVWPSDAQTQPNRVEDMAAHYLREVHKVQPEGPYLLGGFCFGGRVAFEMAQQLRAEGQPVALLALFDAYAPGCYRALPDTRTIPSKVYDVFLRFLQRAERYLDDLKLLGPKHRLPYILERAKNIRRLVNLRMRRRRENIASKAHLAISLHVPCAAPGQRMTDLNKLCEYVPKVYPGKVTLFRARKRYAGQNSDPEMGWSGLAAGGLEIHEIPGYYQTIIREPRVHLLAQEVKACLDRVRITESV
jgi:amino acid adenylation domain-containing protein